MEALHLDVTQPVVCIDHATAMPSHESWDSGVNSCAHWHPQGPACSAIRGKSVILPWYLMLRTCLVRASRAGMELASSSLTSWLHSAHTSPIAVSSTCSSKGSAAASCRNPGPARNNHSLVMPARMFPLSRHLLFHTAQESK